MSSAEAPPSNAEPDRRRLHVILAAVAIVCGAIIGYLYLDEHWPYRHFRIVDEGVFYRSALLSPDELAEAIQDYDIKTAINLREGAARAVGTWWEDERRVTAVASDHRVWVGDRDRAADEGPARAALPGADGAPLRRLSGRREVR